MTLPETPANTPRLGTQLARVRAAILGVRGGWCTLADLAHKTGDPEASVSARLRDIRRELRPEGDILRCVKGSQRLYCAVLDASRIPLTPSGFQLVTDSADTNGGDSRAGVSPQGVSPSRSNARRRLGPPPVGRRRAEGVSRFTQDEWLTRDDAGRPESGWL